MSNRGRVNKPISRRTFCVAASSGLVLISLPGCDPGASGGGADLEPGRDLRPAGDMAAQSRCPPGGVIAAGAASTLKAGQAIHLATDQLFVVRDAQGIYALTDVCTHQFCPVAYRSGSRTFYCSCHGSTYDANGDVTVGPASTPLVHYAVCIEHNGDVVVDTGTEVDPSTRA
jgi:Rieske Fe-S protein